MTRSATSRENRKYGIESPDPCPTVTAIPPSGMLKVRGIVDAGTTEVYAKVYRRAVAPHAEPPADATPGTVDAANLFAIPDVAGFLGNLNGSLDDNILRVWSRIPNSDWDIETNPICGQCSNQAAVNLTGRECIWFAWVPMNQQIAGPRGEQDNSYRPVGLTVPQDATSVTVNAAGSWRHNPSDARASGANGLDGQGGIPNDERGLEVDAYRHDQFNSLGITPLQTHLNKLIVLWEFNGQPADQAQPYPPIVVGAQGNLEIPPNASRLFLAFHDGHEWSNNSGQMQVTIDWQ